MTRKKWFTHGIAIFFITLFVISAGSKLLRNKNATFECKSDIITRKSYVTGGSVELRLAGVFLYDGKTSLNAVYQGLMKTESQTLIINRTFSLKIKKMHGSNIYQIVERKIDRLPDDTAPPGIVDQLQLDNIDYLYITQVKDNALLIQSVILPSMICTRI
ncbi:hypothetical protein AB1287_03020 [Enterobacter asburiae]|uniref:hypothetical protein n=1 Tax=Scandinavium sp. UTDF21-P1B TaxID=3446379 RepID=UPI00348111B5